jgi:SAM-dependent methyltransferase
LVHGISDYVESDRLHQFRSFFGVLSIRGDQDGTYHRLIHGTTVHGKQYREWPYREEALTYYHRRGPVGHIFQAYPNVARNFAVIGLGTGTMASYCQEGDHVTFYEIDKTVRDIAEDPKYFSYLTDARERGAKVDIVLGDARLQLEKTRIKHKYRLIIVDAFSSDAIPIHLITREAVQIYFDKLTPDGLVAFHISNRHLRLKPVLFNLVKDAGYYGVVEEDDGDREDRFGSTWVVLARDSSAVERLLQYGDSAREIIASRATVQDLMYLPVPAVSFNAMILYHLLDRVNWEELAVSKEEANRAGLWTDDYSNLFGVFSWK